MPKPVRLSLNAIRNLGVSAPSRLHQFYTFQGHRCSPNHSPSTCTTVAACIDSRPRRFGSTVDQTRSMSTAIFRVQEHTLPTSHIREYPRATVDDQEDVLQLAIKQYTPRETFKAKSEVTVIGGHANGFPKVRIFELLYMRTVCLSPYRSCMNLYGMSYIRGSKLRTSVYGPSLLQMWQMKAYLAC